MLYGVVILGSELKESLALRLVWALAGTENPNFSVINIEILKLCFGFFYCETNAINLGSRIPIIFSNLIHNLCWSCKNWVKEYWRLKVNP
jgi:hypothetical protein